MSGRHIAVSGLMGAGKSTLVRGLGRELNYLSLEERFEENPYLSAFYRDPAIWAFRSYIFFFQRTLEDYRRASEASGSVQERVLEEHYWIFGQEFHARGYIGSNDLDLLGALTETAVAMARQPDLLIHIEIDPQEAIRRLRHRANKAETGVEFSYLESLGMRYEEMLDRWSGPLLRLDASSWDFRESAQVALLISEIDRVEKTSLG